jgi:hypothetical protein
MKHKIPEITAEATVSCIEALSKKEGNIDYLSNYINHTPAYTKRAINMGEQLGLFIIRGDIISLSQNCSSLLNSVNSDLKIIFKDALFNYKPFILLVDYIIRDDKVEDAIRKTKTVFEIDTNEKIILKTFNNFCRYIGIPSLSKERLSNLFSHSRTQFNHINKIINTINNNFEAQIFLSEKLGQNCFGYVSDAERKLLTDSVVKVTDNSSNAIDDAAGAFESFLRRIGKDRKTDCEKSNGIDELGQCLGSKTNQVILPEHRKMCSFIGTFRNPAVHKVHKTELEHWKIETDSAMEIILLILTCMRSIYSYVFENKRLLL